MAGSCQKISTPRDTTPIRSLIVYSSLIVNNLSKQNLLELERIQRAAVKIAFHLKLDTSTSYINSLHSLGSIEKRLDSINLNFLTYAVLHRNPLVKLI